MTTDPRYPIGKFEPQPYSEKQKADWLRDLETLPGQLEQAVQGLDEHQLETPYREGGWTVKQVVHHVADSHINAYVRIKLALTEENPPIKTYEEKEWAELADVHTVPINVSLTLLHALHRRWLAAIKGLDQAGWERTMFHPVQEKNVTIWWMLGLYAWHGKHHLAHIQSLKEQKGW